MFCLNSNRKILSTRNAKTQQLVLAHRQYPSTDAAELLQLCFGARSVHRRRGTRGRMRGLPMPLLEAVLPQGTHEETPQARPCDCSHQETRRVEYALTKSRRKGLARVQWGLCCYRLIPDAFRKSCLKNLLHYGNVAKIYNTANWRSDCFWFVTRDAQDFWTETKGK